MKVVIAPDQRLRAQTKPVKKINPKYQEVIRGMVKLTKTFIDPEGVGLASTQIGESGQYFIMKMDDGSFRAVFNPKIIKYSKKTRVYFEGCLSIPNYYGEVTRPISVTVSYQDIDGQTHKEMLTKIEAWIFQHEYDHIQGKLFMDLVHEQKGRLFKVAGKDKAGAEIFEEVAL